jgi:hypothetical protein
MRTRTVFSYHHVHYFDGVDAREKYDRFFAEIIRVKNKAILSLAKHAHKMCVNYTRKFGRNYLKQSGTVIGRPAIAGGTALRLRKAVAETQ